MTSPPAPRGAGALRRRRPAAWLSPGGVIAVAALAALPLLARIYSTDLLTELYAFGALALVCQGAERWDARAAVTGEGPEPESRGRVVGIRAGGWQSTMRVVVVVLVLYFLLVGVLEIASGISGSNLTGQSDLDSHDAGVGGLLLTAACLLCLGAYAYGIHRVPGLGALRRDAPISWLALATVLITVSQNLSPHSAKSGVATTVAQPVDASDLIRSSLPFGVMALVVLGPGVRRGGREMAARLGVWPLRVPWLAVGAAAGLALVPVTDALFATPDLAAPRRLIEGLGAAAVGVAVLSSRSLRRPLPWLGRALPAQPVIRWGLSVAGLLLLGLGAAEALGHLSDALPADCVAQQQQVFQSLAGGPMGRSWIANVGVALAAGMDEELLFRGALQPRLGLVATSLVFASYHLQYTCHGLPAVGDLEIVILGIAFGVLRNRGGLWAAIAAHAFYDGSILLGHTL